MYGRLPFATVDFSRYRLTRLRVVGLCAMLLAIAVTVSVMQFAASKDLILPAGAVVGGDYVAFYAASHAAAAGEAAAIYDPAAFEALLHEVGPERERYGLTWQYPPTYFLLLFPLAFIAYAPGYALWTGATALGFLAALRSAGLNRLFLFVIVASPPAFQAVITGQNGFLTAALLAVAALFPDKRPIAAGLAAALLTVKPQLGLLIPIAYLAGGCWRAFAVAAAGALALAGLSLSVYGSETWVAFVDGVRGASGNLTSGNFPLFKMATPFAGARYAGLPTEAAAVFHGAAALAAACAVGLVWRRVKDAELRAAALLAGVFLAAPYAYYYEMVILALPLALVAKRGLEQGWIRREQVLITAAFLLTMLMPGQAQKMGVSWGLITVLIVAAAVIRRIAHEHPQTFRLRKN